MIAGLVASFLWAGAANAAFADGGYCVGGPPNATGGIGVGDVTLNGGDSDNCYGIVSFGGDVENEINNINDLGWGSYNTTDFLKDDGVGLRLGFVSRVELAIVGRERLGQRLVGPDRQRPGSRLSAELPIVVDIIAFMKAGTPGAFYFFDDVLIDTSNDGTFSISWTNNGGRTPGLSGFSLFFGESTSRVPERNIGNYP